MATPATLGVEINFSNGASFGTVLLLDDPSTPLDTGVLGDAATVIADVSNQTQSVQIRRGYNRIADNFSTGTATVVIVDETGAFNPDNTSSPYYGLLTPLRKIRISGTYNSVKYYVFSGYIQSFRYQAPNGTDLAKVFIDAVDGQALLNLSTVTTVPGSGVQDSGARINAILDAIAWPSSMRSVQTGASTLQADPGGNRSALDAILTVDDSELGAFYFDELGQATFINRTNLATAITGVPTIFTDDGLGTDISYQDVQFNLDDTQLVNYVSVQRVNGTAQIAFDQSSIDAYFQRTRLRQNLLMQTDEEAYDQANTFLFSRKDSEMRIDAIVLDCSDNTESERIEAALSIDFFAPIRVTRELPGGAVTRKLLVQGIQHNITQFSWVTTLETALPQISNVFILDSPDYGVLDQNALSY